MLRIAKLFSPVLVIYFFYFFIVSSHLPFLYQNDFFISYNRLIKYLNSTESNSLIFLGPSTLASSIAAYDINKYSKNISVFAISPTEIYSVIKKLAIRSNSPKCIVFSFNYNRLSYFNNEDPLDVNWLLFADSFMPYEDLKEYLKEYNDVHPEHIELNYLQFYARLMLNKLKLTRQHLKLFFSFFFNNPHLLNAKIKAISLTSEGPEEFIGIIPKDDPDNLNFFSLYNIHFKTDFAPSIMDDRYFLKIVNFAKSKNIRTAFLFTPVSFDSPRSARYTKKTYRHLQELLRRNDLDNFSTLIYNPDSFNELNFIDVNHIDSESAIKFSKSIKEEVLNACQLK